MTQFLCNMKEMDSNKKIMTIVFVDCYGSFKEKVEFWEEVKNNL